MNHSINPTNPKKLLFVLRQTPYGNSLAKEALHAVLATSVYEQDLSVLFIGDGVFQLLKKQDGQRINKKNVMNILSAFPLYDIEQLFVCETSLKERNINVNSIPENIRVLSHQAVQELLHQQDHLLNF